jgi:hypothetical protein
MENTIVNNLGANEKAPWTKSSQLRPVLVEFTIDDKNLSNDFGVVCFEYFYSFKSNISNFKQFNEKKKCCYNFTK